MKIKRAQKPKQNSHRFQNDEEIEELQSKYDAITAETIKRFSDFPLSQKTQKGLSEAKYVHPTAIQRESIGPALQGKDVLGAAITGSGKTLAFLIPVIEHLYVKKWSRMDGTGAIIISPTRELAYQIFETLKKIGKHHDFSAGLIIGGKNLKFERKRMDAVNILICTPGRLLQHMDENPLFNASTMEMLILDEADRCLDMGFEQTLNAIIDNFPPERQTLLFSATQTSSVKDLVRLNLNEPVYIGHSRNVNDDAKTNTTNDVVAAVPDLLQQNFVVLALEEKLTMLWSFIKNHLKQKIIVFLSSCKQVKYIYEIFCKLRPGTSLLALYGTLHQDRRIAIYNDFVKKSNVVLFATDIASRGLDFPAVNWVVQLDCPEDATQYIHRAGRSARNKTRGESLLVLLPSEETGMLKELAKRQISVRQIHIDPKKLFSPRAKIEGYLAQNLELKATAQRAFVSYLKSIFLMRNKKIFKILELDFDAYAKSLGLAVTPRVRFLERHLKSKQTKSADAQQETHDVEQTKAQNTNFKFEADSDESDDDDFIKVKRRNHTLVGDDGKHAAEESDDEPLPAIPKKEKLVTKAALAKKAIRKKLQINDKRTFDEEGNEVLDVRKQMQSELAQEYEKQLLHDERGGIDINTVKKLLHEEDKYDKQRFRELVKQRHKQLKEKLKQRRDEDRVANSDDEESYSESENSVDLSWLPDPNKIYKNKANADDDEEDDANKSAADNSETDEESEDDVKAKKNTKRSSKMKADSEESNEDSDNNVPAKKRLKVTEKLTLNDAEVIAAQLLANSF